MNASDRAARLKRFLELGPEHPAVIGLLDLMEADATACVNELTDMGLTNEERAWWAGYTQQCRQFRAELVRLLEEFKK